MGIYHRGIIRFTEACKVGSMTEFTVDTDDNDNLVVTCNVGTYDIMDLIDELYDRNISWYVSNIDGWSYLYDSAYDRVYLIDDYTFNKFRELRSNGKAVFPFHENKYSDYGDYEWNDDREWTEEEMKL